MLSRHRIQKVCLRDQDAYPIRAAAAGAAHPPDPGGERALIWCRAGICAADFEAHTPEIAAACYARQARVAGNKRWAQLLNVDIVRRDTLGADHLVPPGIARMPPKWRQAS